MRNFIASTLLMVTATVYADPAPFGLEIGKATVSDAEKMYGIEQTGVNKFSNGPMYNVELTCRQRREGENDER